jgi:hypothetical protein
MRWIIAVVVMTLTGAAHAAEVGKVCDKLLVCRNYSGNVTSTDPSGEQNGAYNQRITIFKLSMGTVLLSSLIVYGDGGRIWESMTWDFIDEKEDVSPDGKFAIYSDIPDLGGTNKIGTGQCVKFRCTYEYAVAKEKKNVTGTLQFKQDGAAELTEREVLDVDGKKLTTIHRGTLALDEK